MKRRIHRLPVPQNEFGFTPDMFNLFQESTTDGERIARERAEVEEARRVSASAQAALFSQKDFSHE